MYKYLNFIWFYLISLSLGFLSCGEGDQGYGPKYIYPIKMHANAREILAKHQNLSFNFDQKPLIFFYLIDTLRRDHITKELTPNLFKFSKEVITFDKTIPPATVTFQSFYSIFFSRHAYERNNIIRQYVKGATNLRVLKDSGYSIHLFGNPTNYFCYNSSLLDGMKNRHHFFNTRLLFSNWGGFLDSCATYLPNLEKNYATSDDLAMSRFLKKSFGGSSEFYWVLNDAPHDPYSWLDNVVVNPITPSKNNMEKGRYESPSAQEVVRNSYRNAVAGIDHQFKRFINHLKNQGVYDNSIIVVLSDHGENLFEGTIQGEERFSNGHGGPAYEPTINSVLMLRLPKNEKPQVYFKNVSAIDIFPSIFSYLGMKNREAYYNLVIGRDIFSPQGGSECKVIVSPLWDQPPIITFHNRQYKLVTRLWYGKEALGGTFEWKFLLDLKDNPIHGYDLPNYSDSQISTGIAAKREDFIKREFQECLDTIGTYDPEFRKTKTKIEELPPQSPQP